MLVSGNPFRTIWLRRDDDRVVQIIDQTKIPWRFEIVDLRTVDEVAIAIRDMWVRGAGLIGATAGYGMYVAALEAAGAADFRASLAASGELLIQTRPTAVNLAWAVNRQLDALKKCGSAAECITVAKQTAVDIANEDAEACRQIGRHGLKIIEEIAARKNGGRVNVLTHCNAGWLAFVDHGSATSPIYAAHDAGIPVHVWVDETRPRNQGLLTAWELASHGVPHTYITDNAGGHLMQRGQVDLVFVGADRVTRAGDVCNKIGTYLKALAARAHGIPFYAAVPTPTIDWAIDDALLHIPIEERDGDEVRWVRGLDREGRPASVAVASAATPVANPAFDVTPAALVTALVTEKGVIPATEAGLAPLRP